MRFALILGGLALLATVALPAQTDWPEEPADFPPDVAADTDKRPEPTAQPDLPDHKTEEAPAPVAEALPALGPGTFYLEFQVAFPPATPNVFQEVAAGAQVSYFTSKHFGFALSYYFLGTEYYWFDHAANVWMGPTVWSLVPDGGNQGDWQFYHTRHLITPLALVRLNLGKTLELVAGAGPGLNLLWVSEAAEFYPEFRAIFDNYQGTFRASVGSLLQFDLRYVGTEAFTAGVEALFQVPDWAEFADQAGRDPVLYFRQNANLVFKAGMKL